MSLKAKKGDAKGYVLVEKVAYLFIHLKKKKNSDIPCEIFPAKQSD